MGYITMNEFAWSGGLCSQLQIFAGLKAVAKSNNMKIAFSQKMIDGKTTVYVCQNSVCKYPTSELKVFKQFMNSKIY